MTMHYLLNPRIFVAVCLLAGLGGVETLSGQVVQLPSYHNFSISTAVSVPDQGTASLGGVGYYSSGSSSNGWGPYGARAAGMSGGASAFSLSAQIIDLQAMDEAILGVSSSSPTAANTTVIPANNTRSYVGIGSIPASRRPPPSPGAWQRVLAGGGTPQELGLVDAESSVRYYLQLAGEAEQANRIESARVYHRLAVEAMSPELIARYEKALARQAAAKQAELSQPANAASKSF